MDEGVILFLWCEADWFWNFAVRCGIGGRVAPCLSGRIETTKCAALFPIRLEGHLRRKQFEAGNGVHDSIIEYVF